MSVARGLAAAAADALAAKRCWLLDGDGVLYQDRRPLPGAVELIGLLRRRGCRLALLTNGSGSTTEEIATELERLGIAIGAEEILTSAAAAVAMTLPIRTAMVLGGRGIVAALEGAGVALLETAASSAARPIDAVFVGIDRQLSYERLSAAVLAIQRGARFIATNADPGFPTAQGLVPGAGSIVAAVSAVVGRGPDLIAGKPGPELFRAALAARQAAPEEAIMVGDQLETDILGGARAGIDTLLVRTGIAGRYSDAAIRCFRRRCGAPTHVAEDLTTVVGTLEQAIRRLQ